MDSVNMDMTSVALVTGASSGIGRALAYALTRRGAAIAVMARRIDHLHELQRDLEASGSRCLAIAGDVTQRSAFESAVDRTVDTFGRIDLLINNAGRGAFGYVGNTSESDVEEVFRTNVFSLWHGTGRALMYMRRQRSGTIVTIASMAGKVGYPANAHYVAAKHAAVGFTRALRCELVDSGVRATVVVPGGTATAWADHALGGPMDELFAYERSRGAELAAESGVTALATIPLLAPDDVAARILDALDDPPPEIYTHPGSEEFARAYASDQQDVERRLAPYWRANLEFGRRTGRMPQDEQVDQ